MNRFISRTAVACIVFFTSTFVSAADDSSIAVVNVTELFNNSAFVKKANKELQENAKKMEATLKTEQQKLQENISAYQKMQNASKKSKLEKSIKEGQANLNKLTQQYQSNISNEQNKGMQAFTKMVQDAVAKIAKDRKIHTVLNSTSIVYTDNTWVDITKDVEAAMAKE